MTATYALTPEMIDVAERRIAPHVLRTPVWQWSPPPAAGARAEELWLKLELWQRTGTFKARGAINTVLALSTEARARGLVAVSAGNHAIATAWAAKVSGSHAHVVMLERSSAARVRACRALGAEVEQVPDVHTAFERVRAIESETGRTFVHPFEGLEVAAGTATLGREFAAQVAGLDAVVVPIGGGGLCAGVAAALAQEAPGCRVYGVEPEGADSMRRSLAAGRPVALERVDTIADSLGAPHAAPISFGLCQAHVHEVVTVSDDALRMAMRLIHASLKFAVEPACAATTAAVLGPLRDTLAGQRVGLVFCGSNIDASEFAALVAEDGGG